MGMAVSNSICGAPGFLSRLCLCLWLGYQGPGMEPHRLLLGAPGACFALPVRPSLPLPGLRALALSDKLFKITFVLGTRHAPQDTLTLLLLKKMLGTSLANETFSLGQTQSHGFSFLPPIKYSEAPGTRPVLGGGCRPGLEKPIKQPPLSLGLGSGPWKMPEASLLWALSCPGLFCVSGPRSSR